MAYRSQWAAHRTEEADIAGMGFVIKRRMAVIECTAWPTQAIRRRITELEHEVAGRGNGNPREGGGTEGGALGNLRPEARRGISGH